MFRRRHQAQGTGSQGRIVHPTQPKENLAMFGDACEKRLVRSGSVCHTVRDEAPQIVLMARHAFLARLVCRAKRFFVEQHGFFQEGALWRERGYGKSRVGNGLR